MQREGCKGRAGKVTECSVLPVAFGMELYRGSWALILSESKISNGGLLRDLFGAKQIWLAVGGCAVPYKKLTNVYNHVCVLV
jgi:hypothetical protein